MNLKHLALGVVSVIIFTIVPTQAQNPTPPKEDTDTETKKKPRSTIVFYRKTNPQLRPQAPSRQSIESHYCDGTLYVEFSIPEGLCTLTVTDNDTQESDQTMFDSSVPSEIYIGEVSDAHFEILTGNGKTYQGDLY